MARRLINNYNIDTLRLCFRQPKGLFDFIASSSMKIQRDGYCLFIIRDEDEVSTSSIICNVISDDGIEIGTFVFNEKASKYGELCFFRMSNKALYTNIYGYHDKKGNQIHCIGYIMEDLNLEFVSITELHISNDSNVNKIAKFMRYKRDIENFDMIVNRKKVIGDREKIDGYKEIWQSSRKKKENPSIYIQQKKETAPKLCCYNKSIEIEDNGNEKEYVREWNNFGNQTIFRNELRLRWESLKEYFGNIDIHDFSMVEYLMIEKNLIEMYQHFVSRLIHFKSKNGGDTISLHNIA